MARRSVAVTPRNGEPVPRTGITCSAVLIASSNSMVRFGLHALVGTDPRYTVAGEAADTSETLKLAAAHEPAVTFVDLCFRSSMGLQLIRDLAAARKSMRILVASAYDTPQFAGRVLAAGAKGFVQKSAPPEEVLYAFQELTAGRIYVTPSVAQQMFGSFAGRGEAACADPVATLTEREFEIFDYIGHGETTRRIARRLDLSIHTVETYRERIRRKLGIKSSSDLLFRATVWILLNS
jgi:DNA-binding NarL/FixJ family response regulator